MKKKQTLFGVISSAALATVVVGCASEDFSLASTSGSIAPGVNLNSEIIKAKPQSRAAMGITVEDLALDLQSADGSVNQHWASVSDFDVNAQYRVGTYTMSASYGSEDSEGFEAPYYFGSTTFEVEENVTTPVSLTASLANAMVTVEYTDAFRNYFSSYNFKLHTDGGAYIEYAADETRPAYVRTGKVNILADIVKQNGVGAQLEAATFTAQARHHYTVTVDVNGGNAGDAQLVISFDENVAEEDVTIDLSDELLNAPAPELSFSGFTDGATYNMIAGSQLDIAPKYTIIARSGIASVILTTNSKTLEEQGWINGEIDLCKASVAQQAALQALGLNAKGVFGNVDKMAMIDLSQVVKHIQYRENGGNTTTVSLIVKDKIGKLTDPVTFTVEVEPVELTITNISEVYDDDENISLQFSYNGGNPQENVQFMYKNERGTWDAAETVSITAASRASELYNAVIKVPLMKSYVIKAVSKGVSYESDVVNTNRIAPDYKVAVNDNDVFATYAILDVYNIAGNKAAAPSSAEIQVSTDGTTFTSMPYTADGTTVKVTGLAASTKYSARIVFDDMPCKPVSFTTEAKSQIPDSNFETWNSTKKGDYQYLWTVNSGTPWATLNDLTCSQSGSGSGSGLSTGGCAYKATSGTIPANSRTNYSNSYGGAVGTTKKGDGNTQGNATLHSDKGYSGNAALIRTVGWGSGNSAGSGTGNPASGFNACKNVTAGELYLGSYSDGANYSGYSFASRPSSISFFYKYTSYGSSGDYGDCEVLVKDASGNVIASATCQFNAQDSYVQKTLNLNYAAGSAKAASIMVRFKSSANPSLTNNSTWLYGPGNKNVSGGEYLGSELYIDEITLNY